MLNNIQKEKLKASWGVMATSMACLAEIRVYDPLSSWQCYIYAMNPDDDDQILCLIKGFTLEDCIWRLSELQSRFNAEGEPLQLDTEYRPRRVAELFKKLSE